MLGVLAGRGGQTRLLDNSATKQIANKRGNGRLRHVSARLRDVKASKAKIMQLAKFIQRVTALSGLELVAGQSCEISAEEGPTKRSFESLVWQWFLVVAILMVCVILGFLWLCLKHHRMKRQLEDFHRLYEARAMADEQLRTEMERTWSMQCDWCQRLERGLILLIWSFVDLEEVSAEDSRYQSESKETLS